MADEILIRALAMGARAFADSLEAGLAQAAPGGPTVVPTPGSAQSMIILLERMVEVNSQGRGVKAGEMSHFAREAGMDPRGTAGYYAAGLLEVRGNERWITDAGRERLYRLQAGAA